MRAYRAGNVALANAVGTGVADDKAVYAYVPDMIRYYLGEEPILDNVADLLLADPSSTRYVLDHLRRAGGEAGGRVGRLRACSSARRPREEQLEAQRRCSRGDPRNYIAQQTVALSTAPPLLDDGSLAPRHVDLRPFAVYGDEIKIVPGRADASGAARGLLVVN